MSRVDDALLLRDTIQRIVDDKLGKERPKSSYALVTGFNPDEGTVSVIFDGDDITVDIPAGSIYPSEIGQTVKIGGSSGARIIEDVMGENLTEVKARTAQETADGKNTVNYGETPPEGTDHKAGDIWFNEGNSNMPHVWKDGNWVSIEDLRVSAIAEAQDELRQDLDTVVANGVGTKSFYKPTEPTAAESKEGDLWFDTSESGNNELHTYVNGQWVSAADARIAALKDAQTQMTGDISAAQQKADEAFQDAADADSKAVTAKSAADAAADAAASAAGIANGKGKVLVQSTAPGAADRNAQTLWIDTTGGANTPKRWVSGTTWSAVTDKAATDAASAAATAQTKANEAKTAADAAQSAADAAQTAASNAQSTATEALTSANSKNTVTRSTANPTTPYAGRVDDIWWKMSTLSSGGRVIAQYRWSGTAWLTETIDNAVIANLDAAKITTGYLAAARIKANTLNADTVLINGSLGSIILRDGAITTPKIAVGAITAESGVVASLDAGKITVGTLAAARFAANTINADSILVNGSLGSTIIKNGAITTAKLATGAITAESGVIGSLDASKITVGKLSGARLEADAINGMQIIGATIATSTGFPRVQLDSAGLHVYKSSSVRSFFADAATGDLDVIGNFRTGTSGPRVEMTSKASSGGAYWGQGESGIAIFGGADAITSTVIKSQGSTGTYGGHYNSIVLGDYLTVSTSWSASGVGATSGIRSTAGWNPSGILGTSSGLTISDTGAVFISGPKRVRMYTENESVQLDKETATASITASNVAISSSNFNVVPDGISEISSTNIRPIRISYTGTGTSWLIPFHKGTTEWGYVGSTGAMSADDFGIQSAAGKTMVVMTTNSSDNLRVTNRRATLEMNSYSARFDIDNARGGRFQVPAIYNVTASGTANVVVNSSGTMFRSSSSLRYKQDIQDFSPSPSILDIETKTWRDKTAVTLSEQAHEYLAEIGQGPLPRDLQEAELEPCRHFGAIAEEVDALGLSELVEYDHAGRPDALKYPMFGVALIPEVRKLRDRIAALEALFDTPTGTAPVE